ncbi:hypothetical protein AAHA92_03614 [Salvia divinorum]|uniref:Uncharacterized protein n=1 Tax=Salvia divinorum TaxID=28513 RepID=A0ABD1IK72_SALDI
MATKDESWMREKLEAPMPSIGMYVALASLACSLAIAADLVHGFRSKKLWFPSNYFSLNATTLALLAVALKLPVDLTTNMTAAIDRLAKISSLALTSTAIANFVPSLGSMTDRDILVNVAALSILIFTVAADFCIQIIGTWSCLDHRLLLPEEILALGLMLLLVLVLVSTAIMALTAKKCLETKYQEKHNLSARDEYSDREEVVVGKLMNLVKKYWVMAETSNPQFVIARSSACASAGVICLGNALILVQAIVRTGVAHNSLGLTSSSYGFSTKWILLVQAVGMILGTVSTSFRWLTAVRFRCSVDRRLRHEFKVEDYWTRKLLDCQESPIHPLIKHQKCRRFLYNARRFVVYLIIKAQICVVMFNKLVLVISCCIAGPFINIPVVYVCEYLPNVRPHSLRLEGEADLPDYMLRSIPKQVDEVLEASRRKEPTRLIEFLRDSSHPTFRGVAEFDSLDVKSIHRREPKSCWSLAVFTLASIAVAIPGVEKSKVDKLVKHVSDGLFLVKTVEESFYSDEEWKNIRKAADFWLRVDLFRKWQEIDLAEISASSSNSKEALERLANESKTIALSLKRDEQCPMFNPANWEPSIIAANSMYRISTTILKGCDEENAIGDGGETFDRLSRMIADLLAACLTNLARLIEKKCHLKGIEERERSVRQAAILLGRCEEILTTISVRARPAGLNAAAAAYIEEWRRGAMPPETESTSVMLPEREVMASFAMLPEMEMIRTGTMPSEMEMESTSVMLPEREVMASCAMLPEMEMIRTGRMPPEMESTSVMLPEREVMASCAMLPGMEMIRTGTMPPEMEMEMKVMSSEEAITLSEWRDGSSGEPVLCLTNLFA